MSIKLLKYKTIEGIIKCETGLRIGGQSNTIQIGGVDSPVIRNPINDFPYIPGSSLKGKIRSLLEWKLNKVDSDGKVHSCQQDNCVVCLIFGPGKSGDELNIGPSRAIFRDANLTKDSIKMLEDLRKKKGLLYIEEKTENVINRIKGKAEHPRTLERVPAGTEFNFEISYRVFEVNGEDNKPDSKTDEDNFNYLIHGLWLLQQDALGGSGSRGYGKVKFLYYDENDKDEEGKPKPKDNYVLVDDKSCEITMRLCPS